MVSKKLILVLALACLAIFSIVSVSAGDFLNDETTIAGHDFNIPDGYKKNESFISENETTSSNGAIFYASAESYYKGEDDIVYIQVSDYSYPGYETNLTDAHVQKSGLGEKEFINGHEGLIAEKKFDDLNVHAFFYAEDGDLVCVMTTDDSLFEQIIPEE